MDILILVKDNKLFRFVAEHEVSEPERKTDIKKIIDIITGENIVSTNNITKLYDNIDKFAYNTSWRKLQPEQQIIKIDEYVDNADMKPDEKIELGRVLHEMHKSGKLKTTKDITYDVALGKIIKISVF
jgi:hypothetical protein